MQANLKIQKTNQYNEKKSKWKFKEFSEHNIDF